MILLEVEPLLTYLEMNEDDYRLVEQALVSLDMLQKVIADSLGGDSMKDPVDGSVPEGHEYITALYDSDRYMCLGGFILKGTPTLIPFFGLYLETHSGYITMDNAPDTIVLGNIFTFLRITMGTDNFDADVFISRIEKYYLGEIETLEETFTYSTKTQAQADNSKSYLYNLLTLDGKDSETSLPFADLMEYMGKLFKLCKQVERAIAYSLPTNIEDTQNGKFDYKNSDLSLAYRFAHKRYTDDVANFYQDVLPTLLINDADPLKFDGLEYVFNQENVGNTDKAKSSKSENNYLRMLPLIEASQDDEMKCFASLLGEKQEIIDSIKSSKFKDVIKGAFLKGVITKKKELLARITNFKQSDKENSLGYNTFKDFLVLIKFYSIFDKMIVKKLL